MLPRSETPVNLLLPFFLFVLWISNFSCSIEKDDGPPHKKKYVCSVKIPTADGVLYMMGDEKSRVKEAENSAASLMIRALQEAKFP